MTTTTVTLKMAISWHSRNWKLTIITKMTLWHWVSSQSGTAKYSRCARFPDILQNCVVHQVFGRKCLIVFLTFTPKLPIQTSLSVAPTRSVFWRATQFQKKVYTPVLFYEKAWRGKTRGPAGRRRISAPQKSSCCSAGCNIVNITQ